MATQNIEYQPVDTGGFRQPDLRHWDTHTGAYWWKRPVGDKVQSAVRTTLTGMSF